LKKNPTTTTTSTCYDANLFAILLVKIKLY
jgi:hypothetical protein